MLTAAEATDLKSKLDALVQQFVAPPAPPPSVYKPIGFLDAVDGGIARGWADDQDAPQTPVTVIITVDGVDAATVTANGERPDVTIAIPWTYHSCGYQTALDPKYQDGKDHVVRAYALDADGARCELGTSPKTLTWAQPAPAPVPQPSTFAAPDIMDMDVTGTIDQSVIASGANINPVLAPSIMQWVVESGSAATDGGMSGGVYGNWSSYIDKFSGDGKPIFGVDPDTGLHYLECGIPGGVYNSLDALNWFVAFGKAGLSHQQPVDEIYCAYSVMVMPQTVTGVNPALFGVKLSGLFSTGGIAWIGEHSARFPAGVTDTVAINDYSYSAEGAQRADYFGGADDFSAPRVPVASWLTWEMHGRMNTPGLLDGVKEIWVTAGRGNANRKLMLQRIDVNWRGANSLELWAGMQVQFYLGGQNNSANGPCRWRIARPRMSTKPIGLPPELL